MSVLLERLGLAGMLALLLLAATTAFHLGVQKPMDAELAALKDSLARDRAQPVAVRATTPESQMDAFYRFFEQPLAAHEWLAKLHAIARASAVALPSADYRLLPTGTRIARYQFALPLTATYAQARVFMANALNEIPVLSVDSASFERIRPGDPRLEVEIVMTLHLLEP